jgi:hypothetical protein
MKFRALNLDYHIEATVHLWEERQKKPKVIIRLLGPEENALDSNKDGKEPIVPDAPVNLESLEHKEESSTIDEPCSSFPWTNEEPESMNDITEDEESHEVSRG